MPDQTTPMVQALTPPAPQDKQPQGPGLSDAALSALFLVPATDTAFGDSGYYHIKHDSGRVMGHADLSYNPEDQNIHVNMIRANPQARVNPLGKGPDSVSKTAQFSNYYNQTFGPSETRSLLRDTKRVFPEAQTIEGYRVSGARQGPAGKGSADTMRIPLPKSSGNTVTPEWATPEGIAAQQAKEAQFGQYRSASPSGGVREPIGGMYGAQPGTLEHEMAQLLGRAPPSTTPPAASPPPPSTGAALDSLEAEMAQLLGRPSRGVAPPPATPASALPSAARASTTTLESALQEIEAALRASRFARGGTGMIIPPTNPVPGEGVTGGAGGGYPGYVQRDFME